MTTDRKLPRWRTMSAASRRTLSRVSGSAAIRPSAATVPRSARCRVRSRSVAAWTAARCFPMKVTAPDLKSDANEAAIESLEIAHEGLKLVRF